jgi:LmbE family N-acetylglucosaminyl deacetylase
MGRFAENLLAEDLKRSAIVFSPHFDDETLACGGTILKKKAAGAHIKIVFMTDSSTSHRHLMPEDRLKAIRAGEALAAGKHLGIDAGDLLCLNYRSDRLGEQIHASAKKVARILRHERPEDVFIPYSKDQQPDHMAANASVRLALRLTGHEALVYEYPVWFWSQWPWIHRTARGPRGMIRVSAEAVISGLAITRDFNAMVYVGDVLETKMNALAEYRSQMTRLVPGDRWLTLADINDGEFLECFLGTYEIFRRYPASSLCRN